MCWRLAAAADSAACWPQSLAQSRYANHVDLIGQPVVRFESAGSVCQFWQPSERMRDIQRLIDIKNPS